MNCHTTQSLFTMGTFPPFPKANGRAFPSGDWPKEYPPFAEWGRAKPGISWAPSAKP